MATLSKAESRRLYSWWWDSHISPKNSKWLAENLTDMDAKVKLMIKLIESDADSFARRADMYYKQRPELMKLVEESYRAYRALAERYDHATGALRQAHRTMAEAFPNQVSFAPNDDSPSGPPGSEGEPRTPEMPHPMSAPFDPEELHKDALGLSPTHVHGIRKNGAYSNKSDSISSIQGLKQLNALFGSAEGEKLADRSPKKSLNFNAEDRKGSEYERKKHDADDKHNNSRDLTSGRNGKTQVLFENDVASLKQAIAKLEAEKEASLLQYQKSLESLSDLESKVYSAHEDAKGLNERANKAEDEVQTLKHALMKLDDEKKAGIVNYLQCLERITELETKLSRAQEEARSLNERASNAEHEAQTLKQALARLETENEAALLQYKQCLERISDLETKLSRAEDEARRLNERGDKAEAEVQSLTQTITSLNEGMEDAALQYQHCLEKISDLETKISHAKEEASMLNEEIAMGITKLKASEEQHLLLERANITLQAEVDNLMNKAGVQKQELKEKHEELEIVRLSLQDEQLRGMQAEDALITLRSLYSKSQEEQRTMELELQNWVQMLKDLKLKNQGLEDEVSHLKEENSSLHELNLSSTTSIKNFQDEVICLKEAIGKLEGEVELRVDQRNALQQEIYCLREEINDLSGRHGSVIEQVESVGLKPDCLGLSVKNLQEENSQLKEITQKDKDEKASLLEKLSHMKQLSEKNVLVENSLSDANAELEVLREKLMALEESFDHLQLEKSTLADEKSVLISQLGMVTAKLEKLSEKNTLLEKSLADLNVELDGSKATSKSLEESCRSLKDEKSDLITERDTLVSKLEAIEQRLKDVEKSHVELEGKHSSLEKEKESILRQVEEMRASLNQEKQVHASFVQSNETRLASLEDQMQILQEDRKWRNEEFEEEQDRTVASQFETFVMQRCILDVEEKNFSLLIECQKYFEASKSSEKLINKLEQENLEQQLKVKSLMNQVEQLRRGIHQMLKSLHSDLACGDHDEKLLQHVVSKIEEMESHLLRAEDEKQQLMVERSVLITLLQQLKMEASDLESQRNNLDQDLMIRTKELLLLQSQKDELLEMNIQLRQDVGARDQHVELLKAEMEMEYMKLSDLQESYLVLRDEKSNAMEENKSLMNEFSNLKEEKCMLEEENNVILEEVMVLSQLCLLLKSFGAEKSEELQLLSGDVDSLQGVNGGLEKEITKMREGLEIVEAENLHLKESVEKLENELITFKGASNQLNDQIGIGKELLKQKEMELSYVQQKLKSLEDECMELEQQIRVLTEDKTHQHIEIVCLQDVNEMFESELAKLHEEINEYKTREEILVFELQETRNELEICEAEAEALYDEQQISITHAVMFKEKATELKGACDSLEDERASQVREIKHLKESIRILQSENHGLRSEMAMYLRGIYFLADSITSLEDHVLSAEKIHREDRHETKDAQLARSLHGKSSRELSEARNLALGDKALDLQELQARVKAMEMAVMKMKELKKQDDLDTNRKNVILVKDIPLDQVSGSSPYDPRFDPSRRRSSPKHEDILELWQTTKQDRSISMKVNKIRKLPSKRKDTYIDFEAVEPKRDLQEEELVVDKLEVSKTVVGEHREGSKRRVLERLASDAQKLTNLQITVQDLKMKVEKTSKSERSKHVEYEMVEGQLHEIETAIMQLIALNGKLTDDAEEGSFCSDRKAEIEMEETRKGRTRVSEQARRGSEKIGRLLVEVQKIQFILLKLDGGKETKGITAGDRRRVLLRDYLYGDRRSTRRRKRDRLCACIKPSTKEDW